MTSQEVQNIINYEIRLESNVNLEYRLDISERLLHPIKQNYKKSNDSEETYERWTVFTEREDNNGYFIYFDEESKNFGLAVKSDKPNEFVDIGIYGSFLKTLYSI